MTASLAEQIEAVARAAIADKVFPGCVIGWVNREGARAVLPFGNFTYDADAVPIEANSIFDVASVTKVVPVSSLVLQLIDQGHVGVDDLVFTYLPELRNSARNEITIRHLLTQTLDWGFPLSSLRDKTAQEILDTIFSAELKSPPGSHSAYSNTTSILLGLVIERATGMPLDTLAQQNFFEPLRMTRTSFDPSRFPLNEIVPTEINPATGEVLRGEIHDESARILRRIMVPGSAGLFSTAPDLLNFLEMLLNGGEVRGHRYFSPDMVKQMHTNQLAAIGESAGLGWELNRPEYMGNDSKNIFGKTGFTGCVVLGDALQGMTMVMLSNHVYPRRLKIQGVIHRMRKNIAKKIFHQI